MSTDGNNNNNNNNEGEQKVTLKDLVTKHNLQDELNSMMAENRRKLTQQNQELVTQLEQLKQNSQLTQEERDALQVRITQLEEQYMTKEELAKREAQKTNKQFEEKLNLTVAESKKWQELYSSSTIERSLLDACVEGEVLHPSQVVEMLRSRAQLTEVIEDGKPTGKYTTIVKFNDVTEDGKNVVLDLSPVDTIKRMKEVPQKYGNLFKGTGTSGLGGSGSNNDGSFNQPKLKELMSDPVKYAEWRKKNPDLDFTKLRS